MRFLQFLLILLCSSILALGQSYTWDAYTAENSSLKSNNLITLNQDDDGILWIGSDSGLTGYNGTVWVSYNATSDNLAGDSISSIRTSDRVISIGTNNGLSSGHINTIDDVAWESPYRTDNSVLINNMITTINIDSMGIRWICTDSGITVITDTSWESLSASSEFYLSGNKVLAINQQPTQMQYVGTENGGVSRLYYGVDGITGASTIWKQWTSFPDSTGIIQPGLLSDTVTAIMVSKNGDRWYGTQHGVSSHTGDFLKNPYSWTSYTTDNGLIDNNVQTLAEDSSGAIWIGTMGGASKLTPEDIQLTNFTMDSGLVSNDIRDIEVAEDGTIWFATAGGLSKLTITPSAIHNMNPQIAESFKVHPAYPNPFNMNTTMEFELFSASRVNITIFNINGQVISKLLDSRLMPGSYKVNWNGENESGSYIASGVYFARISASNRTSLLKLVLVK